MNELVKAPPAQNLAEFMQGVLRAPDIPADKLEALWRMRKELLAEEHREAFDAAYAAMSAELPQIRKDGKIELTKDGKKIGLIPFARWEDMDKVIRPIMAKYGFALSFTTAESRDNKLVFRGTLTREGHSRSAEIPVPPDVGPGRNALQAVGSATSYAKRYLTEMLLNLVRCGEDDDGYGAGDATISTELVAQLQDLLKRTKTEHAKFLAWSKTGAKELHEIKQRDFVRLLNALNDKLRKGTAK